LFENEPARRRSASVPGWSCPEELKSLKKREAELTALQDFASKNRVDDELKLGMRDALWTPGVMSMTKTAELKKLLVERFVDLPLAGGENSSEFASLSRFTLDEEPSE
jgi:hypothetical protein